MSEILKSVIKFNSANGHDTVAGYYYTCESVTPKAILQISHGMCEHINRYADFAAFMARQGYVVCGNDHLGHGETSGTTGVDGFFAEKDGRKYVLQDLHRMNSHACKAYPGLPLILLGHSMGSFFARLYAVTYPDTLQGLIISGTGGPQPMASAGILLSSIVSKLRGPQYRSNFINKIAFGTYLKQVENPASPHDWISRDAEIVATYGKDAKCTFTFTASAFHELFCVVKESNQPQWAQKVRKNLPVFVFSGDKDPVGDYGKGVQKVYEMLKNAGVEDVALQLYPEGRHEMLNETNRAQVYDDVLRWCNDHIKIS